MVAAYQDMIETSPVNGVVRAAKQIDLQPYTQHRVLINMQTYGLLTIQPIDLNRHSTLGARDVVKVFPGQLFFVLVYNFSNRKVRLPKRRLSRTQRLHQRSSLLSTAKIPEKRPLELDSSPCNHQISLPNSISSK